MKKLFCLLLFTLPVAAAFSQSNTFPSSGNVGIGTTSPSSTLHLSSGGPVVKLQNANHAYTADEFHGWIGGYDKDGTETWWLGEGSGGSKQLGFFTYRSGYDLKIINKGKGIIISDGGNVGIGTDNPTKELSVKGTIQAKEVIVESNWSDFVFEDGYELRSLRDVESHIEEHGHLSDVPSAAEIQENGLAVAEAQTLMMQKIEELTLYMIEKDKEVAELRSLLEAQRQEIEELKTVR